MATRNECFREQGGKVYVLAKVGEVKGDWRRLHNEHKTHTHTHTQKTQQTHTEDTTHKTHTHTENVNTSYPHKFSTNNSTYIMNHVFKS